MGNFKKRTKTSQEIPTSALPDIIFILLFFFVVVARKRPDTLKVQNKMAKVTQVQKLENLNRVINLYIGAPVNTEYGVESKIQMNDKFVTTEELPSLMKQAKELLGQYKEAPIISLKIDKNAKLGVINDVQETLRKLDIREISYNANKGSELEN